MFSCIAHFFYRTSLDDCTFPKFYVMIDSLSIFGYEIDIFQISCLIAFVFLHNSIRISIPWLICTCFHTKIVTHYNVASTAILIWNSETTPELQWLLLVIYFENCELYTLLLFSLEVVLQGVSKNKPSRTATEIQATLKHAPAWKLRRENVKFIVTNCEDRFKL